MSTTINPGQSASGDKEPQLTNKKYKVDIYADDSGGTLDFYVTPGNDETRQNMQGKRLKFPNGTDWYEIEYKLDDQYSSVKVKFKDSEPICIKSGTVCPAKGVGNQSNGQISVVNPQTDKKLTVENKNQNEEIFSYTLFFTDMNGADVGELDPIYDNGGGGHQFN